MVNNIGRLLQPYVSVVWGSTNITPWEHDGIKEIMAQEISINLDADGKAPGCEFKIVPSSAGMQLFAMLKERVDEEISVKIGYPNGNEVAWKFVYAGLSYTTGMSPKIAISTTSSIKGEWTDNKVTFTSEEPIKLYELPELLQKKSGGKAEKLKFEWAGKTKEAAQQIEIQPNRINQTPHNILVDTLREYGMVAQVGDTAFDNTVVISYAPNLEGQLAEENVEVVKGKTSSEPGKRNVYIIGPGLMIDITRKQSFNLGQTETKGGSSNKDTKTSETESAKVAGGSVSAQSAAAAATSGGERVVGPANKPKSRSEKKKDSKESKDARAAESKAQGSTVNFSVPMLPYIVGIKPRDIIAIPSLKGPGDFIEDWEVTGVNYTQSSQGSVDLSISGRRVYAPGGVAMMDPPTLAEVKATVATLRTPEKWNAFYWINNASAAK